MANTVLGLSGYRWNNNIKSMILLGCLPFLLLTLLATVFYVFGLFIAREQGYIDPIYFNMFNLTGAEVINEGIPQTVKSFTIAAVKNYWPYVLGVAALWVTIGVFFNGAIIHAATGAKKVTRKQEPKLYNLLENLCISRGITMPHLYVIETSGMNAYASGLRDRDYTITVTRGILERLDDAEIEAVLGHELSHILNRDCRLLVVTIVFAGMLSFMAQMLWRNMNFVMRGRGNDNRGKGNQAAAVLMIIAAVAMFIGYLMAIVLRFALSRRREYMADAGAVELTKNPEALISALQKISAGCAIPNVPSEVRQMFIENPPSFFDMGGLFATHPPIDARIHVLEQIAYEAGTAPTTAKASIIPSSH